MVEMFNVIAGWFVVGMFVAGAWIVVGALLPGAPARHVIGGDDRPTPRSSSRSSR